MKKFEFGKCYEDRYDRGQGTNGRSWIKNWRCIEVKENEVVLMLDDLYFSDYGTEEYIELNMREPFAIKVHCQIYESKEGYEIAYNEEQHIYVGACEEID